MTIKNPSRMLFLGKTDDEHCARALAFAERNFANVTVSLGGWGDPFPPEAKDWTGDIIVSYLSRWVVPVELLDRASLAINFHPASPDYPGIGCTNFAIYENATTFGVTCHHMAKGVDSGPIVAVERFPIFPTDSVLSLHKRATDRLLTLFYETLACMIAKESLPQTNEKWTRRPLTLKDLKKLQRIDKDMPTEEIQRRIRATTYPGMPRPYIELAGARFEYSGDLE